MQSCVIAPVIEDILHAGVMGFWEYGNMESVYTYMRQRNPTLLSYDRGMAS